MKKATEKWLIKRRRENEVQEYHHKRKEEHKIITSKKKLYIKNVTESTEDQKHNNARKVCRTINQFKKGYQHKLNMVFIFVYFYFAFVCLFFNEILMV